MLFTVQIDVDKEAIDRVIGIATDAGVSPERMSVSHLLRIAANKLDKQANIADLPENLTLLTPLDSFTVKLEIS